MKLIDKDALVAEIEKRINFNKTLNAHSRLDECSAILSFLDTIEVKGVDLKKEIQTWVEDNSVNGYYREDVYETAEHFLELGLKAQHDNWKVVDNTNLPQEDRTKIYCVFTKQRYILAKVISHPQDEDLLQWKCTEFPHHRYDMCEGDRYMQIV